MKTTPQPPKPADHQQNDGTLHYVMIADASGSMHGTVEHVRESINTQILELRELPKAWVTVRVFDNRQMTVHDCVRPASASLLTPEDYDAWGSTALYDAVAGGLLDASTRIEASGGLGDDDTVVVLVFTDGMENASSKFTAEAFQEVLSSFMDRPKWHLLFVGSDPEVMDDMKRRNWRTDMMFEVRPGEERDALNVLAREAREVHRLKKEKSEWRAFNRFKRG